MAVDEEALRKYASEHADDPEDVDELVASVLRRLAWRRAHGFKTCSACKQEKKPADFGLDSTRSDGLEPRCRVCRRR